MKRALSPAEKILKRLSGKMLFFDLHYRDGLWCVSYTKRASDRFESSLKFIADDLLYAAEQIYVRLLDACPYHGVGLVQTADMLRYDQPHAGCPRKDCDFRTTVPDA